MGIKYLKQNRFFRASSHENVDQNLQFYQLMASFQLSSNPPTMGGKVPKALGLRYHIQTTSSCLAVIRLSEYKFPFQKVLEIGMTQA